MEVNPYLQILCSCRPGVVGDWALAGRGYFIRRLHYLRSRFTSLQMEVNPLPHDPTCRRVRIIWAWALSYANSAFPCLRSLAYGTSFLCVSFTLTAAQRNLVFARVYFFPFLNVTASAGLTCARSRWMPWRS